MQLSVENVATEVAGRLAPADLTETARREAGRVARGEGGTTQLGADVLTLVGIIVQVCAIVVEVVKVIRDGRQASSPAPLGGDRVEVEARVLAEIRTTAEDQEIAVDPTVREVLSTALDVIDDEIDDG